MSSREGSSVQFRRAAPDVRPRAVARFARKLQKEIAGGRAFDILITGDAELRKLNRKFRGQDYATDVLSFPSRIDLLAFPGTPTGTTQARMPVLQDGLLGDVAISLARARAQAREFGHSAEQEVRILMLHGLLHLLGMDHASDGGRMARAERRWRIKLGLPNGLIDRVRQ